MPPTTRSRRRRVDDREDDNGRQTKIAKVTNPPPSPTDNTRLETAGPTGSVGPTGATGPTTTTGYSPTNVRSFKIWDEHGKMPCRTIAVAGPARSGKTHIVLSLLKRMGIQNAFGLVCLSSTDRETIDMYRTQCPNARIMESGPLSAVSEHVEFIKLSNKLDDESNKYGSKSTHAAAVEYPMSFIVFDDMFDDGKPGRRVIERAMSLIENTDIPKNIVIIYASETLSPLSDLAKHFEAMIFTCNPFKADYKIVSEHMLHSLSFASERCANEKTRSTVSLNRLVVFAREIMSTGTVYGTDVYWLAKDF